jgi:hypothetical protein
MHLSGLSDPARYRGLYVFDFGDWTASGYTAEEVAALLEQAAYRAGKVYKIVRAAPDGTMELRGVSTDRFQLESGLFFRRAELKAARADFEALAKLAQSGAPCRAYVHLADRGSHTGLMAGSSRYVTALIYPAEYDDEIAAWLLAADFAGGETVEGGISHVAEYYRERMAVLDRTQIWARPERAPRALPELLRCVHQAIQR